MTEENPTNIIMDTGNWSCKIGISTEDFPRAVIPTLASDTEIPEDLLFGKNALDSSNNKGTKNLLNCGNVQNWNLMELFWKQAFKTSLQNDAIINPVLVNFYPNSNKFTKEKQVQIFFENFNVPNYFAISNSQLILYSSGRVTGLVLDSGHHVTSVVPVIDGTPQYWCQSTINFGGNDITQFLATSPLTCKNLSQEIKERHCKVSLDFEREIAENKLSSAQNLITLPDGTTFEMRDYAICAPEGVFRPEIIGRNVIGISDLVLSAFAKCDQDLRKDLLNNVVVAGGNTCFLNFNERLQKELQIKTSSTTKVKCLNYSDKITSLWFGGAVISGLGSLQPLWVSKADYDEHGPSIIHRKCI